MCFLKHIQFLTIFSILTVFQILTIFLIFMFFSIFNDFSKIFLKMTPLGVKTWGNPNFKFSKRKNAFLIQARSVYWSEKLQKCYLCLKTTPFWGKNMEGEFEFDIFEAKKRFPDPGKACVFAKFRKNAIFATFRFNIQAFTESGKHFFALKMSNSDSPHVFISRGHFQKKILKIFSRGWSLLLCNSFQNKLYLKKIPY
jgi:hypothetical protein